jgi:hypothetical protein
LFENLAGNTFELLNFVFVFDVLLSFMVRESHDSFTLLSVKDVMLFQHCQQAIQVLCTAYRQEAL